MGIENQPQNQGNKNSFKEEQEKSWKDHQVIQEASDQLRKNLPNDPQELFKMRQSFVEQQERLSSSDQDKESWRTIQETIHAINQKLNELGVSE